ncbi:unnamed protein product [Linum trigynum]|uniref:Transposase n=1 Tax=Linum trigynum TaxID=586398 RepID=A0AAV2GLU0_9ROSI
MIIIDELPFRYVEHEGFKRFMARVCPMFVLPSRQTVREDCIKVFFENIELLKDYFKTKCLGMVSLTTDTWTSLSNLNYMCITAHFIGRDWKLHKRIINFVQVTKHYGSEIGKQLASCLVEWGIRKVFCITMDNASVNDVVAIYMKEQLKEWGSDILDGKYLQMRCVAHIINLAVKDGLKETGKSVERVRDSVKWVKSTPARSRKFKDCIEFEKIASKKFVSLDVATRWNSTYLMLEPAKPFEKAFQTLARNDKKFKKHLNEKNMEMKVLVSRLLMIGLVWDG